MSLVLLIIGIILFIGLVIVHELGHFWLAKRNGVVIEEFGIFFPPKLWGHKTKGGWEFTINALPLGGFVRLKGEHDADTAKGSFGAASTWAKTKIMAAGVIMNLLVAFVLFTLLALVGLPQLVDNQFTVHSDTRITKNEVLIGYIQNNSPAAKAGLHSRDQLLTLAVRGQSRSAITSAKALPGITEKYAGQTATLTYKRNGNVEHTRLTLLSKSVVQKSAKTQNPKGYLGVAPTAYTLQRSTWSAPIVALGLMKQFTVLTFQGLGHALAGVGGIIAGAATGNRHARQAGQTAASSQVSGPVGIFVIMRDGSLLGYQFMLMIIAVISLSLAIMNILPIPALDGGKLFVTYISRLLRKRVSEGVENWVYGTSFLFLLALIALITIVDVKRFF